MKIAYLGMGMWGYCLASLLASKGHVVQGWTTQPQLVDYFKEHRRHPKLAGKQAPHGLTIGLDLERALRDVDMVVESVTAAGVRPVLLQARQWIAHNCPITLTSKGIERESSLILPEVAYECVGNSARIALLSGPGFANEVMQALPTSIVAASTEESTAFLLCEAFTTPFFRVYPNCDIIGVAYGGALKNVIAIACGIAEGLSLGYGCAAALVTRGLHEIRKLAVAQGARLETLSGLSGLGDICLTCSSPMSRNFRFGFMLAQGLTTAAALHEIGSAVEGAYTCTAALQLGKTLNIDLPITEAVYEVVLGRVTPKQAVDLLLQRTVKLEHL